jgi:hypothetical protein
MALAEIHNPLASRPASSSRSANAQSFAQETATQLPRGAQSRADMITFAVRAGISEERPLALRKPRGRAVAPDES